MGESWSKQPKSSSSDGHVKSALYGANDVRKDVTQIVQTIEQQQERRYLPVLNAEFGGDPLPLVYKELQVIYTDGSVVTTAEGGVHRTRRASAGTVVAEKVEEEKASTAATEASASASKIFVFYHIFVTNDSRSLDIVKEQLAALRNSVYLYERVTTIFCGVSGNDELMFAAAVKLVDEAGAKFVLLGKSFVYDRTYERLTLHSLIDHVKNNARGDEEKGPSPVNFYLYLHSKGAVRWCGYQTVANWRRCMEFFVIEQAQHCVAQLASDRYDAVGAFFWADSVKGAHYSGNFWWASSDYLLELAKKHPVIGDAYLDPEMWIGLCHPEACCLYEMTPTLKRTELYDFAEPREQYEAAFHNNRNVADGEGNNNKQIILSTEMKM